MENPTQSLIKLSKGNTKIRNALIWNIISRKTCPGATDICKEICYAHNTEVFRGIGTTGARNRHTEASKRVDFKEMMSQELKGYRGLMRLHESGDFYNQRYLDDWVEIISSHPNITFWAYTKSWMLDFTEALKLKNLYLRYSIDASTEHYPKQKMPVAQVSATSDESLVCPGSGSKGHEIKCMRDCSFCVESRESLIFRPHGKVKLATEMERAILATKDIGVQV